MNPLKRMIYENANSKTEFAEKVEVSLQTITNDLKKDFSTDKGKLTLLKYALKLRVNLDLGSVVVRF